MRQALSMIEMIRTWTPRTVIAELSQISMAARWTVSSYKGSRQALWVITTAEIFRTTGRTRGSLCCTIACLSQTPRGVCLRIFFRCRSGQLSAPNTMILRVAPTCWIMWRSPLDSTGQHLVSRNRIRHRRRHACGALLGVDTDLRAPLTRWR